MQNGYEDAREGEREVGKEDAQQSDGKIRCGNGSTTAQADLRLQFAAVDSLRTKPTEDHANAADAAGEGVKY